MLNGILHECDPSDWAKEQYPDRDVIPLYTHPVNPKYDPETGEPLIDGYPLFSGLPHPVKEQLTDEEILKVIDKLWNRGIGGHDKEWVFRMNNFARAILRKAQK